MDNNIFIKLTQKAEKFRNWKIWPPYLEVIHIAYVDLPT